MDIHLLLLILHVIGAGVTIGVVILAFGAIIKPPTSVAKLEWLEFMSRFGMWASAGQFVTGVLLFLGERDEFQSNPIFWTKIALWVIEGAFAANVLNRAARRAKESIAAGQTPKSGLKSMLAVHAVLILAIAVLGVVLVSGGTK